MSSTSSLETASQRSISAVILVLITFLAISVITNILGPLLPLIKQDFNINNTVAGFFPLFFFIAYGVVSIPAGIFTEKFGGKTTMALACLLSALGALAFASAPSMSMALMSLFFIGCAMAFLQVVINPLLRIAGGEEHYAFFSTAAQMIFAVGGMLTPQINAYFVHSLKMNDESSLVVQLLGDVVPAAMPWISMYWMFALISMVLLLAVFVIKLPSVELNEDEKVGGIGLCLSLLKNKTVLLFFLGIACYVGAEQGIAASMLIFLEEYHGVDPLTVGADTMSAFWAAMAVGCLLGLALLKVIDTRKVLMIFVAGAIVSYLTALYTSTSISLLAYAASGFFLSVMFPAIMSLGLNSVREHHGSVAGILCSGIAGGAVVPVIVGFIADTSGDFRLGALFVLVPLAYMFSIGLWAKPLITNKTISLGNKNDGLAGA